MGEANRLDGHYLCKVRAVKMRNKFHHLVRALGCAHALDCSLGCGCRFGCFR